MAGQDSFSESDQELIDLINKGAIDAVRDALDQRNISCRDKSGMTPLMHASFKGNADMVELFLKHGADVNDNGQEHKYTALMFATLSGSLRTIKILLEAGANTSLINSVNRTAAQMGAFVGRHDCVSLINNFLPKNEIDYYTIARGLETDGKLPAPLSSPLHDYLLISTFNPVKLALYLSDHVDLLDSHERVLRVIGLKCESLYKTDTNEVLALKFHHFGNVFTTIWQWHSGKKGRDGVDGLIKFLLRGRPEDGFQIAIEDLTRESIRTFPYSQSNIFQQLVKTLAPVKKGDHPTAQQAIMQSVYGMQAGADGDQGCATCGHSEAERKCSACKQVLYCDSRCQKYAWPMHKRQCKQLAAAHQREEAAKTAERVSREERSRSEGVKDTSSSETEEPQKPCANGIDTAAR